MNHFEPALNGACGTAAVPHQCSKAVNLAASQVFALRHGDLVPNLLPAESPTGPAAMAGLQGGLSAVTCRLAWIVSTANGIFN